MDNSWQNKCSSTWQSMAMSSAAAAAQVQPQQSRNHLPMNTGQYLHPHVEHESRSTAQERLREPTFLNTFNLGSYKPDSAEMGNSFLALLSGSSSLLQCDTQQLSNQKPLNSVKLPINSSCAINSSARSGVPLTPTGPRNGTVFGPIFSSSAAVSTNFSSTIGFPHGLPAASFNLQSSDLARAVLPHNVPGNGKVRDNSSLREEGDSANSAKLQRPNSEASQKMSSEKNSSLSNRSSNFLSGCPRVLCLSICGDLLLSNTGLLGVVCSCHCLHMSISKFCEHSGLYDVNPGDAVHMDNGETIAQWRKLYFQKFGIRVPDDHSGWDWPECFSATAGLVKSSMTMPITPQNVDFYRLIGSPGGSVRSGQARDNVLLCENSVTDQNHLNDTLQYKKQRNGQDNCNVQFKGLTGASHSNFRALADNQMSRCSTMSKFVDSGGSDNGCQTISAYSESVSKSRNSFISQPTLQNLRIHGTDSNLKKACNLKDAVNLDQDVVSSNIELRLGQPYQQSWTSGNTLISVVGPKPLDTLGDPPKPVSQDHLIHNKHNFGLAKNCNQNPQWVSSTSDFSSTREQNLSNFMNYALGANNAVDATKLVQCNEDATKNSVISMLLSHINSLSEGNAHSRANHNKHNANEQSMHGTVQCESHIVKSCPINIPWNSGDGLERHINIKESGVLNRHRDEGKGVKYVSDGSHFAVESDYGFEKRMERSSFLNGGVGGSSNPRHFSGMPLDASDGINFFNYSGKVPTSGSSGQFNNVIIKSSNLAIGTGTGIISPPQAASMCFSSAPSTSIPSQTSVMRNKEAIGISPYIVDENLRLLAARHMLELYKQGDAISSPEMKQHGRFGSSSHVKIPGADPLCAEQIHRLNLTNKNNMSEVVLKPPQSSALHSMGGGDDKLAPMAGLKNWCNLSTFMQGNPMCSKEVDVQCQSSHGPFSNKHHPLRLGRTESIISSEHGKSCQRAYTCFLGNCSCTIQTECLGGDCNSRHETSINAFKEQIGSVSCKELLATNIDTVHKENTISSDGNLKEHMRKKINFHSFQWKDVPNKVVRVRNMTHVGSPTNALDGSGCNDNKLEDAADKCLKITEQEVSTLKGKEMSNISSGCSTPAVIQESIDVTNTDSCTVDESDGRYVNDLVIDEGSANDKCGSSDDVLCSDRSAEFLGSTCKPNLIKERFSKALTNQSSCNLIDDLKFLDSLRWKKVPNQIQTAPTTYGKSNHLPKVEGGIKCWKKDRDIKRKVLDASLPASGISSVNGSSKRNGGARWERCSPMCNDEQMILSSDQGTSHSLDTASLGPNLNNKRSSLSSIKTTSCKRDLRKVYNHDTEEEDVYETYHADSLEVPPDSCVKRLRQDWDSDPMKLKSVGSTKAVYSWRMNGFIRKARPVVYGKYGIISNGTMAPDMTKPAKIVPLSKILKTARCTLSESCEARSSYMKELKKKRSKVSFDVFDDVSGLKEEDSENHKATVRNELDHDNSMEAEQNAGLNKDKECADELYRLEKERNAGRVKLRSISDSYCGTSSKPKTKEIRKRSLCELIVTGGGGTNPNHDSLLEQWGCSGNKSRCAPEKKCKSFEKFSSSADNSRCQNGEECHVSAKKTITEHRCEPFISDSGAFCCVCGSFNKDEINCLLECSRCLIRVHQACYGVAKVPKGSWYCRPCRTSSKDIACVLCGYGGGAMTRALRSHDIVKSLLKAWNIETEYRTNNEHYSSEAIMNDELRILNLKSEHEGGLFPVITPLNIELSSGAAWKMNMHNQSEIVTNIPGPSSKLRNSITVGVLDPTVKQWVHMVCGLWTPGTRCPNVDTMSAFDVSGAAHPRASVVCSICNRPGGSYIKCRVINCSVQFHPWCAHQKGLLQSEVEGVENESVGFYGRCVLHATCPPTKYCNESNNSETDCPRGKELTCARTEGYKGRKRDGFKHNVYSQSHGKAGCLVPQEQLNAWLHINGKKLCTKGLLKQPVSDIEHDHRKEYARYKHAKGWKHLVVYKSGIHALGLYTSRFITRGAMVVEYVGEIVGLRVADKRECEYQSGRKLQYKSACYFFRIDKEHIIDATCKGGIARFVNHSCLPNCVAKVISVRNEKKVVFFAERDIYPGEEITYDYHFNHEDEGKKIPCFCNAKNCRQYMN